MDVVVGGGGGLGVTYPHLLDYHRHSGGSAGPHDWLSPL